MAIEFYRDLNVWQRAIETTPEVYRLTAVFPREELFALSAQMRRAATLVASPFADRHGRTGPGEYRRLLGIARG